MVCVGLLALAIFFEQFSLFFCIFCCKAPLIRSKARLMLALATTLLLFAALGTQGVESIATIDPACTNTSNVLAAISGSNPPLDCKVLSQDIFKAIGSTCLSSAGAILEAVLGDDIDFELLCATDANATYVGTLCSSGSATFCDFFDGIDPSSTVAPLLTAVVAALSVFTALLL